MIGDCQPSGCSCKCHVSPHVKHVAPGCDRPPAPPDCTRGPACDEEGRHGWDCPLSDPLADVRYVHREVADAHREGRQPVLRRPPDGT